MPTADPPLLHAIVPAGGAGTRLWPLSRRRAPKFLLDLTGSGRTLLQETVDRLVPLTTTAGVTVVTGAGHAPAVHRQLPELAAGQVLAEPSPRDSMAAIGLAAAVLARRHGDVVVGSFAADHVIADRPAFERAVREAVDVARGGRVVTIGVEADHPATAFGYIRAGDPLPGAPTARQVRGFTEKPDAATAAAYLATGEYRWNAGMFVARAAVLLGHLAEQRPALHDGLQQVVAAWDTPDRERVLAEVWPGLEKVAIDHAIAEPVAAAGGVAVVPAAMGWDDVGDFTALAGLLPAGPDGVRVLGRSVGEADGGAIPGQGRAGGSVLAQDADGGLVVPAGGRLVAVLGLPDVVVVDTPDALLVTDRSHAQAVKGIVDALGAEGRDELL
ncbi:mannose-1-phosphate guanylyltransferase [Georgenia sp. TF02-10]|uniref:mannose-1-phosphate guanylyltransferase n=1 Tax=Georgenia sp. TF02-10 TaxID=2917725 RepID=UPI001FA7D02C|nr:sugar phosphate nucleotidyltransferase [Georgenia sp. TF02-10]UNX54203.1 mannose-1-phosphate guanylyltransferase [Georgenia sp. TF02-10]